MLGEFSPVADLEVHASPERQVGEEEHNSEGEEAMETHDTAAQEHAVHELVKIHTEEQDILNNDFANWFEDYGVALVNSCSQSGTM